MPELLPGEEVDGHWYVKCNRPRRRRRGLAIFLTGMTLTIAATPKTATPIVFWRNEFKPPRLGFVEARLLPLPARTGTTCILVVLVPWHRRSKQSCSPIPK